jgi:cutinase
MARILITSLYYVALFAPLSLAQGECPALPETGVQIGEPVPIVPGDIPAGCSSYEILVGQ